MPFIALQVDENGLLPSETTVRFDNGLLLRYVHPRPLNADYAIMPEALVNQQIETFCDELTAAIDALDDPPPFRWLPLAFGLSAVLWLGLWLLWRWLV